MATKQNPASDARSRNFWSAKAKADLCRDILAKRISFESALKRHGLQKYQLESWIGQYALTEAEHGNDPIEHTQTLTPGTIPPALASAVGEWVLRNNPVLAAAPSAGQDAQKK